MFGTRPVAAAFVLSGCPVQDSFGDLLVDPCKGSRVIYSLFVYLDRDCGLQYGVIASSDSGKDLGVLLGTKVVSRKTN